jgi:hypothetical protein
VRSNDAACVPASARPSHRMARSSEQYVRPALVASESPSRAAAAWRFRLGALLVLILLVAAVIYMFVTFSGVGAEDPGLGGGLPRVTQLQ